MSLIIWLILQYNRLVLQGPVRKPAHNGVTVTKIKRSFGQTNRPDNLIRIVVYFNQSDIEEDFVITPPRNHNFQNQLTKLHIKSGTNFFAPLLLILSTILLMGCTTFASTAVVLTAAGNQSLDNGQAVVSGDTHLEALSPLSNHEPGKGVPVTTTVWIRPFFYNPAIYHHEETVAAVNPEPVLPDHVDAVQESAPPAMVHQPGKIEHVVIITIDGLRPDALDLANTPTLDSLREQGAYSPNAQTIIPSFTLPSHVSMLTGVAPPAHGIVEALPCIGCRLSIGPTLFNVAHNAGLKTGALFGKEKLGYLVTDASVEQGSVDSLYNADVHDTEIKDNAVKFITEEMPNLLFIHFPDVDRVGHEFGWMSENQMYAINYADTMIGEIVAALKDGRHFDNTLLIISADHGGHGFKHGDDSPIDRTIPWLAVGPGVPAGVILSSPIATIDTAATAAYALNLTIPERWTGTPVLEIFQ